MNIKNFAVAFLFLASCGWKDCAPPDPKAGVLIKPGKYLVMMTDQRYSCSDGYTGGTSPDEQLEATIKHDNNTWTLTYSDAPFDLNCVENGTGLECKQEGSTSLGNLCTYPFTLTISLSPTETGFIGTSTWLYDLITCSNGNTGNCTFTSILEGTLES